MILFRIIFISFCILLLPQKAIFAQAASDWYMSGANPQRTSWINENITSFSRTPLWHRPIESYIPQHVQLIAVGGKIFVSTANGLVVMEADTGNIVWQFNTQMPLGNSPTVFNGYVYVAGYDKKVYVLPVNSSGSTNVPVYTYDRADAGYDTNPLVISRNGETWVYVGDREGIMHAFTFNESTRIGAAKWYYQAGKSGIHFSAAYHSDRIYFASNDNQVYALSAGTGQLVWKSQKLPGFGFFSWWPVIHIPSNSVIVTRSDLYRDSRAGSPGSVDIGITGADGDYKDIFGSDQNRTIGPIIGTDNGKDLVDLTTIRNYHNQKPWRRTMIFLDLNNGNEKTFPSNSSSYAPYTYKHTGNGTHQPPVVMPDGLVYLNNLWNDDSGDPKGKVMGWDFNYPSRARLLSTTAATAEPEALSGVGNYILRNLCCDRIGSWESINGGSGTWWSYNLRTQIGDYDPMWIISPDAISGHHGWYQGNRDFYPQALVARNTTLEVNTVNGTYNNHGDQNAIIYHQGKVFTHRHNTIIAFGNGTSRGKLPLLTKPGNIQSQTKNISLNILTQKLENTVRTMIETGYFRPGYSTANVGNYNDLDSYFYNPGETIYTLALAYPYLSSGLKTMARSYLAEVYSRYFAGTVRSNTGWANLEAREGQPLPDDVSTSSGPSGTPARPDNAYYLYLYAKNVDGVDRNSIYQKARSIVPASPSTSGFADSPYIHNQYLAAYIGLVNFQQMLGINDQTTINTLNSLKNLRVDLFDKDSPWMSPSVFIFAKKQLDPARNFMYMNRDLGLWYRQALLAKVNEAMDEYEYMNPYWFVNFFNSQPGEATFQNLYVTESLFKVKAWIQNASREELLKYFDAPAFEKADLYYVQELVSLIEAPSSGVQPTITNTPSTVLTPVPTNIIGNLNNDRIVDILDFRLFINYFNNKTSAADFNKNNWVDIFDFSAMLKNFGRSF